MTSTTPILGAATTLLLLLLAASAVSAQSCAGRPNGYSVADVNRCNYYFSCFNGQAYEQSCPSGFLFDVVRQTCVPPSTAGCIRCPAAGFANLAVPGACQRFVQCFHGVATDRECPRGTAFDVAYGQCNLAQNVRC